MDSGLKPDCGGLSGLRGLSRTQQDPAGLSGPSRTQQDSQDSQDPADPLLLLLLLLFLTMDGGRVSDFSIERILSPQLGPRPPGGDLSPDSGLHGLPGGFTLDSGSLRVPVPVPVPVQGCLQYRGVGLGEAFYPHYGAGFHPAELGTVYANAGVYVRLTGRDSTDAQLLAGYHGYHQAAASAQPCRQKSRMRTVFTDSQSKQLEALFDVTDYPPVEARAEVARSTGLSEETVRVWFKNRRARRKRQRGGSKVKSPSPPRSAGAETKLFSSFL